mmetsp:Transcript_50351/g.75260  ORF Transcript_50351/g.75260 Transcript_50351/m.75260 type:complete len:213 (+) Transcript_50351:1367-2005(+)
MSHATLWMQRTPNIRQFSFFDYLIEANTFCRRKRRHTFVLWQTLRCRRWWFDKTLALIRPPLVDCPVASIGPMGSVSIVTCAIHITAPQQSAFGLAGFLQKLPTTLDEPQDLLIPLLSTVKLRLLCSVIRNIRVYQVHITKCKKLEATFRVVIMLMLRRLFAGVLLNHFEKARNLLRLTLLFHLTATRFLWTIFDSTVLFSQLVHSQETIDS